jgi:hypothetical protein
VELQEFRAPFARRQKPPPEEKNNTVETYSMDVAGVTRDGSLHLNQPVATVQKKDSASKITERQVEQPTPGNPSDALQVSAKTKYTVRYAAPGMQQTKTIQTRDVNGTFNVVSVQSEKADQLPSARAPKAPSHKPH